jgi:hypothetical protein
MGGGTECLLMARENSGTGPLSWGREEQYCIAQCSAVQGRAEQGRAV